MIRRSGQLLSAPRPAVPSELSSVQNRVKCQEFESPLVSGKMGESFETSSHVIPTRIIPWPFLYLSSSFWVVMLSWGYTVQPQRFHQVTQAGGKTQDPLGSVSWTLGLWTRTIIFNGVLKSSLMNLILLFKCFMLIYKLYYNLTVSHHVVQAGLQFTIFMAQLPECWGYRNAPPHMAYYF